MKKAGLLAALLLMMAALACCGKEEEEEEVKPAKPAEEQVEEIEEPEPTPTQAPAPAKDTSEQEALYKTLSEWSFLFSSGAGGWGTDLNFNEDGSYSGMFMTVIWEIPDVTIQTEQCISAILPDSLKAARR